nr:MAG TPA: hypothetical protein [Caudoviricetes sp.]
MCDFLFGTIFTSPHYLDRKVFSNSRNNNNQLLQWRWGESNPRLKHVLII